MMFDITFEALLLGIIEGLTEFLPVSSTGHLILFGDLLNFQGPPGHVFEVAIQLGAILAVCVAYFGRLIGVAVSLPTSAGARRFVIAILLGFLPAVLLGVLAHGFIKSVLFSPYVVCTTLILGGIAILAIERNLPQPRHFEVECFSPRLALAIGAVQTLAMIPGVSRSGATIMGARAFRVDRPTAAEFSFFLAIPTMIGAAVYDLYKNWSELSWNGSAIIALGFIAAFFSALVVVGPFVRFISRHGFGVFAWYRIAIGALAIVLLAMR
jgi:undecaprenyl-diphosphatase